MPSGATLPRQGRARRKKPAEDSEVGEKVGREINRYKVARHFEWSVKDGVLTWRRREDTIRREAELDGIYVIRTSEPAERLPADDVVRGYKGLSQVERAFRCMKGIDLRVRPVFLRTEDRVRAHFPAHRTFHQDVLPTLVPERDFGLDAGPLLCMLAYYVEWHMRRALAPILFEDEEVADARRTRDPAAPAAGSESVKTRKRTRVTTDEEHLPVHSFETLLAELSTQARVRYRVAKGPPEAVFDQLCPPTPLQARAFRLLDV